MQSTSITPTPTNTASTPSSPTSQAKSNPDDPKPIQKEGSFTSKVQNTKSSVKSFARRMKDSYPSLLPRKDVDINKVHWKVQAAEKAAAMGLSKSIQKITGKADLDPTQRASLNRTIQTESSQFVQSATTSWKQTVALSYRPQLEIEPFVFCLNSVQSTEAILAQLQRLTVLFKDFTRFGMRLRPVEKQKPTGFRCIVFTPPANAAPNTSGSEFDMVEINLPTYTTDVTGHLNAIRNTINGENQQGHQVGPGLLVRGLRKMKKLYLENYGEMRPVTRPALFSIIFTDLEGVSFTEISQFCQFANISYPNFYLILVMVSTGDSNRRKIQLVRETVGAYSGSRVHTQFSILEMPADASTPYTELEKLVDDILGINDPNTATTAASNPSSPVVSTVSAAPVGVSTVNEAPSTTSPDAVAA